jgi:hypothetical protein
LTGFGLDSECQQVSPPAIDRCLCPRWSPLVFLNRLGLGVLKEPEGVVAAVVEIGARRRLQVGDEVLGGGGTDVGAVDEVEVGDSGADAAQEGNQRRVVASAEVAVLRSHVVDGVGSR